MADTVRVVHRTLTVLRLMNEQPLWSLQALADRSGLAKSTLHRLLGTLEAEGYVNAPAGHSGLYRLNSRALDLSSGVDSLVACVDIAERIVIDATRDLPWPLSFALSKSPFMQIMACGMPYSASHSARPTSVGRRHWMFTSALGNAYLSRCSDREIDDVIAAALRCNTVNGTTLPVPERATIKETAVHNRDAGYAIRIATRSDINSAVSVPVVVAGRLVGAFAYSTFPHSLSPELLTEMIVKLREAATSLETSLRKWEDARP